DIAQTKTPWRTRYPYRKPFQRLSVYHSSAGFPFLDFKPTAAPSLQNNKSCILPTVSIIFSPYEDPIFQEGV
ncbi:MAG: hypothetical protein RR416_06685, partial [Clostridia bacterium]